MKPEEVFKRYDIRGKYPEELNEEFAERLGKAIGTFANRDYSSRVVVCRDNKESSKPLKNALIEGLVSANVKVFDIGVGTTDFAAWSGKKLNSVSVEVTSSHMPLDFNGFKLMYPYGNSFVNNDLYTVQDLFRDGDFSVGEGSVKERPSMLEEYKAAIIDFASKFRDGQERKVVVDSLGGTGRILPELLEDLGTEVIDVSEDDSPYKDPPSPSPENLKNLKDSVEREDADLGVSHDLDADRITVYHEGKFLTGDELFYVLAQLVGGPVVASIDTSQVLEDSREVEYTRVGDPFVLDKALEIDAELAGEPNGHYSFTQFLPYNSGLLISLILSGLDIKEKLANMPDYTVKRESIPVEDKNEVIDYLKKEFSDRILSELDGVKFSYGGSEVLVRPSGSSSKIRIIAESEDSEDAEKTLKSVVEKIDQL